MGAHVWGPAYLRDHLLPNFQLTGWSMDWYGGLPIYRFYMVVPALAIVALDVILPYGVAFKLVAISGLVSAAVRLLGVRPARQLPLPDARAVRLRRAAVPARRELQDLRRQRQVHDGGRVLVLDRPLARCLGLGLLADGLRTGKYRSWAAIVLALAVRLPRHRAIFVAIAALIIVLVWIDGVAASGTASPSGSTRAAVGVVGRPVPRQPRT